MRRLRGRLVLAFLIVPTAAAQGGDPYVRDEDFDTTPPPDDASYIDDGSANATDEAPPPPTPGESADDPTLGDADFDTTEPFVDTSYLDVVDGGVPPAAPEPRPDAPPVTTSVVPGPGALLAVAAFLVAAGLVARR